MEIYNIAILFTVYNRKEKTLNFLGSLMQNELFKKFNVDIYMLDDGSTDGTSEAVKNSFPLVKITKGDGNLFWAGGMRTIWRHVLKQKEYDLFLLFNDDVVLMEGAVDRLVDQYINNCKKGTIIVGSTLSKKTGKLTYGGNLQFNKKKPAYYRAVPDETKLTPCDSANANILLIDKYTVQKEGIFPDEYVHSLADYDYTLSAQKHGIDLLVAPGHYGYCENDHGVSWLPGSEPLKKRIAYLYSSKGLAYKEYLHYINKHYPSHYYIMFLKLWMKTLFPVIWDKLKTKKAFHEGTNCT